ncbi:MAG: hypothetical protein AAGI71_06570 [Bacteroidota bacterium]
MDSLTTYNTNPFDFSRASFEASDEPFVATWAAYAEDARTHGVFETLRTRLVQLCFPIEAGISQTEAYRQATRQGVWPAAPVAGGLALEQPEALRLELHPAVAGRIPLLIATHRPDFETLVRALTRRNEPAPIPASQGAAMVAGYNNWDRIRRYRAAWAAAGPSEPWSVAFKRLIPHKHRYQDRFILLSDGPYSAVPAAALGLSEAAWRAQSLIIRREHECAHYFTRRVFGVMQSNVLDELIADYMGLVAAQGHFSAQVFLRFMGLEHFPAYREGGRLQNYRGDLPDAAFVRLQALTHAAAQALEAFSRRHPLVDRKAEAQTLLTLCRLTVDDLAAPDAEARLETAWEAAPLDRMGEVAQAALT